MVRVPARVLGGDGQTLEGVLDRKLRHGGGVRALRDCGGFQAAVERVHRDLCFLGAPGGVIRRVARSGGNSQEHSSTNDSHPALRDYKRSSGCESTLRGTATTDAEGHGYTDPSDVSPLHHADGAHSDKEEAVNRDDHIEGTETNIAFHLS